MTTKDLDARVAALESITIDYALLTPAQQLAQIGKLRSDLRTELQTLTAERDNWKAAASDQYSEVTKLQKPALHEPCTLEEAARVMAHLHYQGNPDVTMKSVRFAINSVLQGRAQPAQEEITPTKLQAAFIEGYNSYQTPCCPMNTVEEAWDASETKGSIRAGKGEKT